MKTKLALAMILAFACAMAQHRAAAPRSNPPRANQGRIPAAPQKRDLRAAPEVERSTTGHINSTPHVRNNRWYGHDSPNDTRYVLQRPFEHGRFANVGPTYRYNIVRIDAGLHRFWLPGGFYFDIAAWDWPLCVDWCWTCGDDFVFYLDPDHPDWFKSGEFALAPVQSAVAWTMILLAVAIPLAMTSK